MAQGMSAAQAESDGLASSSAAVGRAGLVVLQLLAGCPCQWGPVCVVKAVRNGILRAVP